MKEKDLVRRILKDIKAAGAKAIKIHGSGYQERGTPDIIGCHQGGFFAIEVKVGDRKVTPLQERRLQEWGQHGGTVTIAQEDFQVMDFLIRIAPFWKLP